MAIFFGATETPNSSEFGIQSAPDTVHRVRVMCTDTKKLYWSNDNGGECISLRGGSSDRQGGAQHPGPRFSSVAPGTDPIILERKMAQMKIRKQSDDEFDKYLVWKEGIGYLPGCSLKFKRDPDGDLQLAEDLETVRKRMKTQKNQLFNRSEATVCAKCFRSELKSNLFKGKFCKDCADVDPVLFKMYRYLSLGTPVTMLNGDTSNHFGTMNSKHKQTQLDEPEVENESFLCNGNFDWSIYLKEYKAAPVPVSLFTPEQSFPKKENRFKPGMKLEGIDPEHPSKFCVLTVAEVHGHRLRLHFDGYSNRFDFWRNSDSKLIFPVGFCAKTNRRLEPIPGSPHHHQLPFDWDTYLQETNSKAAPESCFVVDTRKTQLTEFSGFMVNAKLEAVDIANDTLICVATVRDVLDDQILIHFDEWEDNFDYWTPINSPCIHPINWCKSKGKCLTPPRNYKKEFVWEEYLQEKNSLSVADHLFRASAKERSRISGWKPGMRLEAVDERNPYLIRVASVVSRNSYGVRIHYDGLPSSYDTTFNVSSPDLHPVGWCEKTGSHLEPPPDPWKTKLNTLCPVPSCNGSGHVQWWKYRTHNQEQDCPYWLDNEETEIIDRFEVDPSDTDDDDSSGDKTNNTANNNEESMEENESEIENDLENGENGDQSSLEQDHLDLMISPYQFHLLKENYLEMNSSINIRSLKHFIAHVENLDIRLDDVIRYDCEQISDLIEKITNNEEIARKFSQGEIDGASFLCLNRKDFEKMDINLPNGIKIVMLIFVILKKLFEN